MSVQVSIADETKRYKTSIYYPVVVTLYSDSTPPTTWTVWRKYRQFEDLRRKLEALWSPESSVSSIVYGLNETQLKSMDFDYPLVKLPPLPPRRKFVQSFQKKLNSVVWFAKGGLEEKYSTDDAFMHRRRKGLELFMSTVVGLPGAWGAPSNALISFLDDSQGTLALNLGKIRATSLTCAVTRRTSSSGLPSNPSVSCLWLTLPDGTLSSKDNPSLTCSDSSFSRRHVDSSGSRPSDPGQLLHLDLDLSISTDLATGIEERNAVPCDSHIKDSTPLWQSTSHFPSSKLNQSFTLEKIDTDSPVAEVLEAGIEDAIETPNVHLHSEDSKKLIATPSEQETLTPKNPAPPQRTSDLSSFDKTCNIQASPWQSTSCTKPRLPCVTHSSVPDRVESIPLTMVPTSSCFPFPLSRSAVVDETTHNPIFQLYVQDVVPPSTSASKDLTAKSIRDITFTENSLFAISRLQSSHSSSESAEKSNSPMSQEAQQSASPTLLSPNAKNVESYDDTESRKQLNDPAHAISALLTCVSSTGASENKDKSPKWRIGKPCAFSTDTTSTWDQKGKDGPCALECTATCGNKNLLLTNDEDERSSCDAMLSVDANASHRQDDTGSCTCLSSFCIENRRRSINSLNLMIAAGSAGGNAVDDTKINGQNGYTTVLDAYSTQCIHQVGAKAAMKLVQESSDVLNLQSQRIDAGAPTSMMTQSQGLHVSESEPRGAEGSSDGLDPESNKLRVKTKSNTSSFSFFSLSGFASRFSSRSSSAPSTRFPNTKANVGTIVHANQAVSAPSSATLPRCSTTHSKVSTLFTLAVSSAASAMGTKPTPDTSVKSDYLGAPSNVLLDTDRRDLSIQSPRSGAQAPYMISHRDVIRKHHCDLPKIPPKFPSVEHYYDYYSSRIHEEKKSQEKNTDPVAALQNASLLQEEDSKRVDLDDAEQESETNVVRMVEKSLKEANLVQGISDVSISTELMKTLGPSERDVLVTVNSLSPDEKDSASSNALTSRFQTTISESGSLPMLTDQVQTVVTAALNDQRVTDAAQQLEVHPVIASTTASERSTLKGTLRTSKDVFPYRYKLVPPSAGTSQPDSSNPTKSSRNLSSTKGSNVAPKVRSQSPLNGLPRPRSYSRGSHGELPRHVPLVPASNTDYDSRSRSALHPQSLSPPMHPDRLYAPRRSSPQPPYTRHSPTSPPVRSASPHPMYSTYDGKNPIYPVTSSMASSMSYPYSPQLSPSYPPYSPYQTTVRHPSHPSSVPSPLRHSTPPPLNAFPAHQSPGPSASARSLYCPRDVSPSRAQKSAFPVIDEPDILQWTLGGMLPQFPTPGSSTCPTPQRWSMSSSSDSASSKRLSFSHNSQAKYHQRVIRSSGKWEQFYVEEDIPVEWVKAIINREELCQLLPKDPVGLECSVRKMMKNIETASYTLRSTSISKKHECQSDFTEFCICMSNFPFVVENAASPQASPATPSLQPHIFPPSGGIYRMAKYIDDFLLPVEVVKTHYGENVDPNCDIDAAKKSTVNTANEKERDDVEQSSYSYGNYFGSPRPSSSLVHLVRELLFKQGLALMDVSTFGKSYTQLPGEKKRYAITPLPLPTLTENMDSPALLNTPLKASLDQIVSMLKQDHDATSIDSEFLSTALEYKTLTMDSVPEPKKQETEQATSSQQKDVQGSLISSSLVTRIPSPTSIICDRIVQKYLPPVVYPAAEPKITHKVLETTVSAYVNLLSQSTLSKSMSKSKEDVPISFILSPSSTSNLSPKFSPLHSLAQSIIVEATNTTMANAMRSLVASPHSVVNAPSHSHSEVQNAPLAQYSNYSRSPSRNQRSGSISGSDRAEYRSRRSHTSSIRDDILNNTLSPGSAGIRLPSSSSGNHSYHVELESEYFVYDPSKANADSFFPPTYSSNNSSPRRASDPRMNGPAYRFYRPSALPPMPPLLCLNSVKVSMECGNHEMGMPPGGLSSMCVPSPAVARLPSSTERGSFTRGSVLLESNPATPSMCLPSSQSQPHSRVLQREQEALEGDDLISTATLKNSVEHCRETGSLCSSPKDSNDPEIQPPDDSETNELGTQGAQKECATHSGGRMLLSHHGETLEIAYSPWHITDRGGYMSDVTLALLLQHANRAIGRGELFTRSLALVKAFFATTFDLDEILSLHQYVCALSAHSSSMPPPRPPTFIVDPHSMPSRPLEPLDIPDYFLAYLILCLFSNPNQSMQLKHPIQVLTLFLHTYSKIDASSTIIGIGGNRSIFSKHWSPVCYVKEVQGSKTPPPLFSAASLRACRLILLCQFLYGRSACPCLRKKMRIVAIGSPTVPQGSETVPIERHAATNAQESRSEGFSVQNKEPSNHASTDFCVVESSAGESSVSEYIIYSPPPVLTTDIPCILHNKKVPKHVPVPVAAVGTAETIPIAPESNDDLQHLIPPFPVRHWNLPHPLIPWVNIARCIKRRQADEVNEKLRSGWEIWSLLLYTLQIAENIPHDRFIPAVSGYHSGNYSSTHSFYPGGTTRHNKPTSIRTTDHAIESVFVYIRDFVAFIRSLN